MDQQKMRAFVDALRAQRSAALDNCAELVAELADRDATIAALRARVESGSPASDADNVVRVTADM